VGIECVPEAIEDAKANAQINHIENAQFICAAVEDAVGELSGIDVVLLNPPRKGCEPAVLSNVIRLKPKTVLYISCDPATLARDLSFVCSLGYHIEKVQPFDMFPQTTHVETLVKLVPY
jgi:23S rRNA (uracil1939-C5)-methyltransferase